MERVTRLDRRDPDPATERLVTTPVRQTSSTRVVNVQDQPAQVMASVYELSVTIAGPTDDGSAPVVVNWDAEVTDTNTLHDNGVNPNRITIPAGFAGRYKAAVRIVFISNGTTTNRIVRIRVNGTNVATKTVAALSGTNIAVHLEHEQYMNVGDYFDIQLDGSGGAGAAANYNPTGGPDDSWFVVTKQFV